jgi:queuosine precursor transporter
MTRRCAVSEPSTAGSMSALSPREQRRQQVFLVLAGVFLGNALLAEIIGGKLFQIPTGLSLPGRPDYRVTLSSGIILWPVVFVVSDIVNEYFGRAGVRRLSILGAAIIAYAFVALWIANAVPTVGFSPIKADAFANVFLQSQYIIVGSITAFLLAQLIDVSVFWFVRRRTGHRFLWLRATGSTVVSQVIDTYVVGLIGLYLPHALHQWHPQRFAEAGVPFGICMEAQTAGYVFKVLIALGVTPVLYVVHAAIDSYLGPEESHRLVEATASAEDADDATVGVG